MKLDKGWDAGLVVLGCIVLFVSFSCTLGLAEEVRRMHARMRFERKTNVPIVIHVLSAITMTFGNWAGQLVFTLAMDIESAQVDFKAGVAVASILAPLPLAIGALALLAETARGVGDDGAEQAMVAEFGKGVRKTGSLRVADLQRAVKAGMKSMNYFYLVAGTLLWTGVVAVMHFTLAQALDVPEADTSYNAGSVIGGVLACVACLVLGQLTVSLLQDIPGSREMASCIMTCGVASLYFASVQGLEFTADERYYDPLTDQSQWARHYVLGVSVICVYNVLNVFTLVVASVLSRRSLYDDYSMGIGVGLATCIALDFMFGSRFLQLPIVILMGLAVSASLCVGGAGGLTILGFAAGFGYAAGPYLSTGWVGLLIGLAGSAVMTALNWGGIQGFVYLSEKLEVQRHA